MDNLLEKRFTEIKHQNRFFDKNYSNVGKGLKNKVDIFFKFINNVINKHKGKLHNKLMKEFGINSNINNMLISRIFNVKSRFKDTGEFIKVKTYYWELIF